MLNKNNIPLIRIYSIIVFFLCFALQSKAQVTPSIQKSDSIVKIEGKKYYIHKVQKGQTLYSISKVYKTSIDELKNMNQGLTENLYSGQLIKIPVKKEDVVERESNVKLDGKYLYHKVKPKETLYSIAKKYDVSIEELKLVNPDLSENLEKNQTIKIPRINKNEEKKNPVTANSTKLPVVADSTLGDCGSPQFNKEYKVAFMIPLYLNELENIQVNNEDNKTIKDASAYSSFMFIQFLEGALLAVDSMKKQGLPVRIYIYDVNEDTASLQLVFKKPEFSDLDLIIGPFYSNSFKMVTTYIKSHANSKKTVKLVSPVSYNDDILLNNPNVFKITPCINLQLSKVAAFIASKYSNSNIILVHKKDPSEKNYVEIFKNEFAKVNAQKQNKIEYKDFCVNYEEKVGLSDLEKLLSKEKENILVTLINGEAFITNYVRFLDNIAEQYQITVYGLPSWNNFENIEIDDLQKLKLHLFSSSFINYDREEVKRFVIKFRTDFKTEPEKLAFQGFDISYFFLNALMKHGVSFEKCLNEMKKAPFNKGLQTTFDFVKDKNKGFENSHIDVYKYENYHLVKVSE